MFFEKKSRHKSLQVNNNYPLRGRLSAPSSQIQVSAGELEAILARQRLSLKKLENADRVLELINSSLQPCGIYCWVDIAGVEDGYIILKTLDFHEEFVLHTGGTMSYIKDAEMALVMIYSVGSAVDQTIADLNREDQYLEGYVADTAALLALEKIGRCFHKIAEERAVRLGVGVSHFLSPGDIKGWPIEVQRDLCLLLDIDGIGVVLTDACTFSPFRTVSGVIALGGCFSSSKVGSVCLHCNQWSTCPRSAFPH